MNINRAFTLIGFFIFIAIVGIIIGVIMIFNSNSGKNSSDLKRKEDVSNIAKAILSYKTTGPIPASSGTWCELRQDGGGCSGFPALISQYIKTIPKDPDGNCYKYYSDGNNFSIQASMSDGISSYVYLSSSNSYSLQGKNILVINQSNGTENGNTNGFEKYNGGTLTSSDNPYFGEHSLRVDTYKNDDGFYVMSPFSDIVSGSKVTIQAMVWVPAGKAISFGIRGDIGGIIREPASIKVNGDGEWQFVSMTYALPEKWKKIGFQAHSGKYNIDPNFSFYVDNLKMEYGAVATPWMMGL